MSKTFTVKKGSVIFNEGEKSDCMYYIDGFSDSKVMIYVGYGTDNEVNLNVMRNGQFIGEMGVLNNTVRSATAVALTNVCLVEITKEEFHEYFSAHPAMMLQLLKSASGNLRGLTNKYMDACITVNDYVTARKEGKGISRELAARLEQYID